VDGENVAIEWRYAEGHDELLAALAADLVDLPVDLLVAAAASGFEEQLNRGVPIIGIAIGDPRRLGWAKSLARPGGNYAGTNSGGVTFNVKSIEMLKAVLPQLSRLAILGDPGYTHQTVFLQNSAATAQALGIQLLKVDVTDVEDLVGAFASAMGWSAEALLLLTQPSFTAGSKHRRGRPRRAASTSSDVPVRPCCYCEQWADGIHRRYLRPVSIERRVRGQGPAWDQPRRTAHQGSTWVGLHRQHEAVAAGFFTDIDASE
jgi:hypothetical protein